MIKFDDLRTGNNLAFFGSHDEKLWVRIGRAIKVAENNFQCEARLDGYRYVKMESEAPVLCTSSTSR